MDHIQLFLIIGSLVVVSSEADNFIITPQSVNVTEGSTASFYCRFGAPLRTTWHINGTPWHQLYLANQTIFRAGNYLNQGNRVFNLSMTALPSNNHSVILCIVNYTIYSEPAILLIQGKLQQVEDLTIRIEEFSLVIQWMAPFSLIITSLNSSTEVTYCVDVYNSTDQTLETSICGLNETQYRYEAMSDPSPCDGVDIYVIPVNSAGNGSRSHIIGTFYNEPDSFVISDRDLTITFTSKNELLIEVSIIGDFTACNCSVCIRMFPDGFSTKRCYNALCDNNEVFFLMNELNRNKYFLTIILQNAAGSSTSNNSLEFSTHDVQNISINSTTSPGTVKVDIQFLINSTARGCLLILSQAHHYTAYFAIEKDNDRERVYQYIELLPKGKYIVFGYDIRSYGLPHHPIPAVIQHNFTLSEGSSRNQESAFLNKITVGADGSGNICIHCTISSLSDALGCVVLLHPVNDLSNITVREVIRGLQQPYCINVDRDIYSVAVFEWKRDGFLSFQPAVIKVTAFDQPTTDILLYISIGVGIVVITMVMILGITIIIIVMKYRKYSKVNNSSPKQTGASTTTELASQYLLHPTPDNMTESQYESIDGVGINVTNKNRLSMGRKIQEKSPQLPLQESELSDNEFDDPNYSTIKSLKSPRCTRKESHSSDCIDASQTQSVIMKCYYEDIDDLQNKKYPVETLICAQGSENAEAQKVKHVRNESMTINDNVAYALHIKECSAAIYEFID